MEWKEVRLGDVCEIKHGFAYKGKYFSDTPTCDILVTPGNFTLSGGFKLDKPKFYNGPVEKDYILSKGDLIVTMTDLSKNIDTLGYSALVPEVKGLTFHHNQRIGLVENIANNVDKYFLYWIMRTPAYQSFIATHSSGTTVHHTSPKGIGNYVFKLPPLDDQRRIASILSSLDRKIELNNKINADLEEMAQAIFKNWFVDFEPFKDGKFVDSELGMIPEGWKVGTLGDIVEFQNGFAFSSKDFSENGEYKIITIKSVQDGYLVTDGSSKVTEYPTKMPAYCKLQSGDILLSLTGNVGRCCLVTEPNLLLNQRVAKIKAKESYDNSFSYALFRLKETKELLISISRGTAQANLSPVEASKLPMVIPSEDARKNFSMISDTIMDKIISIHIESSRLSTLRDTLLPRLMSGELEVPE